MKFNITKNRFLEGFGIVVILLALVRCIFPDVSEPLAKAHVGEEDDSVAVADIKDEDHEYTDSKPLNVKPTIFFDAAGNILKHKIYSVRNYQEAFPDSNDLQMLSAQKWGVKPVEHRADAENSKTGLVYIGANPYYDIDPMRQSIPYLVPRAAELLNDIGRAFFDSLQIKGLSVNRFIVTSATRTREDVAKLRLHNRNATENSCHMYGTTFDISYTRYNPVSEPVGNDKLKWVLSEVMRDMRANGRCYVKYEVKQSCFHVTTR
ncbi:MAG: DUF5715 family protein [Prevotella sp.]|uniref:DUF5715 family protein n=1 Tax=Prevotella sp. TaxID=59823 RepID=UPI002A310A88|nr:DUF5715 family protein [Prevotella sp.]MDD7318159.1 DUF5715 family protein [Prevotellaceae bacterium]MDY4020952.1 DUF5715 family protein [Prevotella sp.]